MLNFEKHLCLEEEGVNLCLGEEGVNLCEVFAME